MLCYALANLFTKHSIETIKNNELLSLYIIDILHVLKHAQSMVTPTSSDQVSHTHI
jgi:hypothetical protein